MTVEREGPLVQAKVRVKNEYALVRAALLGRPTMAKGEPVRCELLLESGRYTTTRLEHVEALNAAASVLLGSQQAARA